MAFLNFLFKDILAFARNPFLTLLCCLYKAFCKTIQAKNKWLQYTQTYEAIQICAVWTGYCNQMQYTS